MKIDGGQDKSCSHCNQKRADGAELILDKMDFRTEAFPETKRRSPHNDKNIQRVWEI